MTNEHLLKLIKSLALSSDHAVFLESLKPQ